MDVSPTDEPKSVWAALVCLQCQDPEGWDEMARDLWGISGEALDPEDVIMMLIETNECRNLDSPVEVYIDPDGKYSVEVYE